MLVAVTRYHELILFLNLQGNGLCGPIIAEEQFSVFHVSTSSQTPLYSYLCIQTHVHILSDKNTASYFGYLCRPSNQEPHS